VCLQGACTQRPSFSAAQAARPGVAQSACSPIPSPEACAGQPCCLRPNPAVLSPCLTQNDAGGAPPQGRRRRCSRARPPQGPGGGCCSCRCRCTLKSSRARLAWCNTRACNQQHGQGNERMQSSTAPMPAWCRSVSCAAETATQTNNQTSHNAQVKQCSPLVPLPHGVLGGGG
jgi:hypothetical protein